MASARAAETWIASLPPAGRASPSASVLRLRIRTASTTPAGEGEAPAAPTTSPAPGEAGGAVSPGAGPGSGLSEVVAPEPASQLALKSMAVVASQAVSKPALVTASEPIEPEPAAIGDHPAISTESPVEVDPPELLKIRWEDWSCEGQWAAATPMAEVEPSPTQGSYICRPAEGKCSTTAQHRDRSCALPAVPYLHADVS